MSTVYFESLKVIITLSRLSGILNVCYTLDTGLLSRDEAVACHLLLEMIRTLAFLVGTWWTSFQHGLYLVTVLINGIKYWTIIIAARMSEKWLIEYDMSGINNYFNLCVYYRLTLSSFVETHKKLDLIVWCYPQSRELRAYLKTSMLKIS